MRAPINSLSIKHSILLLTLLPSLFITAVLTTYLVTSRQADAQNQLFFQVNNAINHLAKSSELPMFSGDQSTLMRLANATISNTDMKSVTFYGSNKEKLFTFGNEFKGIEIQEFDSLHDTETNSQWIFQIPVFNSEIDVDDYSSEAIENNNSLKNYLGWIQIIADKSQLLDKQRGILVTGMSVGSILFGLLALLALRFAHSISFPLEKLTHTVKELESGDLDSRVSVHSTGELKQLVDGVNQLAEKVNISNKRLEAKIKEATQKLSSTLTELEFRNKELELKGNDLINANNVKDEFLASVSHELRTPLTSIIGYSELLQKTNLEDEQENQIDTISQASKILLQLIDDILDFSKLESESLDLEYIPFDLNQLLKEVVSLHMPAARAKGIKLKLINNLAQSNQLVGDSLRLEQILNNLVGNAIKFTNYGSVKISVFLLEDSSGLLFKVKDTGIGIDKENQKHLFTPFNQLDPSISRRFGGTGLGLAISKKLVTQFGGSISVESEIDKGTEVSFSILNISTQASFNVSKAVYDDNYNDVSSTTNISLTNKLILIAEDNKFIRNLLSTILEQQGANTITVENGLLALEEIQLKKPDLVILDYQMPVLDGMQTCKEIRKEYSIKELPIVLITADVINVKKSAVKKLGINDLIYKPVQAEELVNRIFKLLSIEEITIQKKILDIVSDEFLEAELNRLKKIIVGSYELEKYDDLKKQTHQLCGIAGSSSKYKKLSGIAKELDLNLNSKKYELLEADINQLKNTVI